MARTGRKAKSAKDSAEAEGAPTPSAPTPLTHHKRQTFQVKTVRRSQLKEAPYNPRFLDAHARKGLRQSIHRDGLVETLVMNARTGNLVSGHQRLAILDEEADGDYLLDVAVVDLDEARERALNVRLNNPSIMGQFDLSLLEALAHDPDVPLDIADLGFDNLDLQVMFPDLAAPQPAAPKTPPRPASPPAEGESGSGGEGEPDEGQEQRPGLFDPAADRAGADIEKMKELKKKKREEGRREDSAGYFVTLVFGDDDECERFLRAAGIDDAGERFVDGRKVCSLVGIDLDKVP